MSTKSTIVTSILTALITSICCFFVLDYIKSRKNKPEEVIVPKVTELTPEQALPLLESRKLRLQIIEKRADPVVPAGRIATQHPLPGAKTLKGNAINVVLSAGPPKVNVPACIGLALAQYTTLLSKARLRQGKIEHVVVADAKPGNIVSCSPASGSMIRLGGAVNLKVAKAEDVKDVPKLTRMGYSRAKKLIVEAGFVVGKIRWRIYDAPNGLVMKQTPAFGTKAKPGSAIDLVVAKEDDEP